MLDSRRVKAVFYAFRHVIFRNIRSFTSPGHLIRCSRTFWIVDGFYLQLYFYTEMDDASKKYFPSNWRLTSGRGRVGRGRVSP